MSEVAQVSSTPTSTPSSEGSPNRAQQSTGGKPQTLSPQSVTTTGLKEATPQQTSPAQDPVREFKIDGKIVKMTQKEADDYVSMSYVAQQRLHEAGRLRKELEAREQNYQKEPLKAFLDYAKKANLTADQTRQALEDYYAKEWIEPETLTAEQRELKALQEYKRQRETEQQEREATQRQTYEKQMTQEQINNVTAEITAALDSAKLPQKNKFLVERMAFYMLQNNKNGWNAPKEMVLKQVVKEHQGIVGGFLKDASMEQIMDYAGQEFIDRVLQFSLENLRQSRNKLQEPFVNQGGQLERNDTAKMDYQEVNRRLRDLRTGKFLGSS